MIYTYTCIIYTHAKTISIISDRMAQAIDRYRSSGNFRRQKIFVRAVVYEN